MNRLENILDNINAIIARLRNLKPKKKSSKNKTHKTKKSSNQNTETSKLGQEQANTEENEQNDEQKDSTEYTPAQTPTVKVDSENDIHDETIEAAEEIKLENQDTVEISEIESPAIQ